MSDNENLVDEELYTDNELYVDDYNTLSGNDEELPMEDQKKAINLQDLVYVKKYVDIKHQEHVEEVDNNVRAELESFEGRVNTSINNLVDGTVIVAKATESNKINGLQIELDENGVLRFGDVIIPQRKVIFEGPYYFENNSSPDIVLTTTLKEGDVIEVTFRLAESIQIVKGVLYNDPDYPGLATPKVSFNVKETWKYKNLEEYTFEAIITVTDKNARIHITSGNQSDVITMEHPTIYNIVQIIE